MLLPGWEADEGTQGEGTQDQLGAKKEECRFEESLRAQWGADYQLGETSSCALSGGRCTISLGRWEMRCSVSLSIFSSSFHRLWTMPWTPIMVAWSSWTALQTEVRRASTPSSILPIIIAISSQVEPSQLFQNMSILKMTREAVLMPVQANGHIRRLSALLHIWHLWGYVFLSICSPPLTFGGLDSCCLGRGTVNFYRTKEQV